MATSSGTVSYHGSLRTTTQSKPPFQTRDDFKIEFTFIDGAKSKEQRKKSRAHVTTQHYRRKRHEKAKHDSKGPVEPPTPQAGAGAVANTTGPAIASREPVLLNAPGHTSTPILPIPYYARGRFDPFAATTFPIPPDPNIHELVDHYCYVIPSLVHRHWNKATRRSRSAWDLFDLYRRDPISFTGILHHASQHLEGMRGHPHESPSTTAWKLRTISGIQARLASRTSPPQSAAATTLSIPTPATLEFFANDDGLIIAVGLLANAERLWGDRAIARIHWAAVKRMLRARGGFPSLTGNKAMHTKLLWSYIALTGTTAYLPEELGPPYLDDFGVAGMSVPFESDMSNNSFAFGADTALTLATDEFTQLINLRLSQERARAGRHLRRGQQRRDPSALPSLNNPYSHPINHDQSHHRFFHPTSPLYTCLAPLNPAATTRYAHPDKRRAHENCRLACLLLLNIVIADLDGTPELGLWFQALLGVIEGEAVEEGRVRGRAGIGRGRGEGTDAALTPEHLLWTLLSEVGLGGEAGMKVFERGWKVGRLQGVAKRLGGGWWRRVGSGLWVLLVGEGEGGGETVLKVGAGNGIGYGGLDGMGIGGWWDAEGFVEEVKRSREWVDKEGEETSGLAIEIGIGAQGGTRGLESEGQDEVGIGECPSGKCRSKRPAQPTRDVETHGGGVAACPNGRCGM